MRATVEGLVVGSQSAAFPAGYSVVLSYALTPKGPANHRTPAGGVKTDAKFELSLSDTPQEMSRITATLLDPGGKVVVESSLTQAQVGAATVRGRGPVKPI